MNKNMAPIAPALLSTLLAACSPPGAPAGQSATPAASTPGGAPSPESRPDAPRGAGPGGGTLPPILPLPGAPGLFAARTAAGGVALVDVESGTVVAEAAGGDLGGESDVACDPWLSRVLLFEADADGEWGAIASHAIEVDPGDGDEPSPVTLGPRDHEVWVDGIARVAASPSGALVFEDGAAGPRWKLVSDEGPTPSVHGPRPAALGATFGPDGLFRVTALTYGLENDALDLRTATVDMEGIHDESVAPLNLLPPGDWPSVRWAWTSAGPHLLSAWGGEVLVAAPWAGGLLPWAAVPVGPFVERIEHALALPGGHTLVALASGEVDVVVVSLGQDGAPLCAATLDLPGEARSSVLFFSRGLVAAGPGRVLAATTSGVFAVTVSAACPVDVAVDASFPGDALRGPIDVCPAAD